MKGLKKSESAQNELLLCCDGGASLCATSATKTSEANGVALEDDETSEADGDGSEVESEVDALFSGDDLAPLSPRARKRFEAARARFIVDNAEKVASGFYFTLDWLPYSSRGGYDRFAARFAKECGFTRYVFTPPYGGRNPVRPGVIYAKDPRAVVDLLASCLASTDGPAIASREKVARIAKACDCPRLLWFEAKPKKPAKKARPKK